MIFNLVELVLKTFNLAEHYTGNILTLYLMTFNLAELSNWMTSWTVYWMTFNLAEHYTGNVLTYLNSLLDDF